MLLHDSLPSQRTMGSAFAERCAQSHSFLDILPVSLLAGAACLGPVILDPKQDNHESGVTVKVRAFRR